VAKAFTKPSGRPGSFPGLRSLPRFDPALLVEDTLEIAVQVNGKLRDVVKVPADATQAEVEVAAKSSEKVKQFIDGKTIRKVIVVPGKLMNIVVS
jgi:leucyl-tRNA synthetase